MKVIDLLNKIANDKEIPKRIKCKDLIYEYQEEDRDYAYIDKNSYYTWFFNDTVSDITVLNMPVEIIEDEEIDIDSIEELEFSKDERKKYVKPIENNTDKINELIKAVKQLNKMIKEKE